MEKLIYTCNLSKIRFSETALLPYFAVLADFKLLFHSKIYTAYNLNNYVIGNVIHGSKVQEIAEYITRRLECLNYLER